MFYGGDERDPANPSMEPVLNFPPFQHYFRQWMGGVTDIEFPKAQYDASIAYMDTCLRRLFTRLEELRLLDETLVVITADHGEELDEHAMWFDHHGLYDTNLHVPLIMRLPRRIPAGLRIPGMVRLMDIAPTILELAGASDTVTAGIQGRSLLPLLSGRETAAADRLFLTECTWMRKRGVRTDRWKLILARDHPDIHERPPVELYDFAADPGEQRNVAEENPDVVAELRADLEEWLARRQAETGLPDPVEEQEITLRQIGRPAGANP
jgi:arylsulfatase A-like enzyme